MTRSHLATLLLCAIGFTTTVHAESDLVKDNPLKPVPKSPLGVTKQLADLPTPPTPQTVRLGRWLYYDKRLSLDNTISCATCHRPENAFSEPTPVSTGIGGKKGGRKAPSFINLAFTLQPHFFWDGRAKSLEAQAIGPMVNPVEMGMPDHAVVVNRISESKEYVKYFKEAFGDEKVTLDRIARSIADYERTRLSGDSRWDRWQAKLDAGDREALATLDPSKADEYGDSGDAKKPGGNPFKDGPNLTAQEKWGHALFFGKGACNQCHLDFNLTDSQFHNLGVGYDPVKKELKDPGRFDQTKKDEDRGAFKTPGLRDISKRAPYMHDGSVATLEAVVELYNKGGEKNPWLSPRVKPLNLTKEESAAIVAFMKALDGTGWQDTAPKLFPK